MGDAWLFVALAESRLFAVCVAFDALLPARFRFLQALSFATLISSCYRYIHDKR
jgi:hypothetical protein